MGPLCPTILVTKLSKPAMFQAVVANRVEDLLSLYVQ